MVRDYTLETLAEPDAVLVVDETGFLKQGKASCGVARQYTGSAGKITNCQIGVFVAYVSSKGHAFIDRALYLPKTWTDDRVRRTAAHVPEEIAFATKPQLARGMIARAIRAGVPFAWVAADSVYGVGEIEMALRRVGKGYVLGVSGSHQFNSWIGKPEVAGTAEEIGEELDPSAWQRLSAGSGTKGERMYEWAYCELADLEAGEYDDSLSGLWTRGLLIRREPDRRRACVLHHLVPGRHLDRYARGHRGAALGHRGRVRDRQDRARAGAQRDTLMARLASPRLARHARLHHDGGRAPPRKPDAAPKNEDGASSARALIRWSVQEIRRVAMRLAQRRIQPAHVIAWSLWRRAHQAAAREAHIRSRPQL